MAKTKSDILEKDTKAKSSTKKTKKVEIEKVERPVDEKIDDVKVDVEIDLRSYNHSDVVGGYIRRKRLI